MPTPTAAPWKRANRGAVLTDPDVFHKAWIDHIGNPNTARKYIPYVDAFLTYLHRYEDLTGMDAITEPSLAIMEEYFDYLVRPHWNQHPGACIQECEQLPYQPPGLKVKYDAISSFYNYAVQHKIRSNNPIRGVKTDEVKPKERFVLLPWEILDLMAAARERSLRAAVVTGLCFGAGLRVEEVVNIDVAKFHDEPRGRLLDFRRKGRDRYHPNFDVPHALVPLLDEHLAGRRTGALILSTGRRTRNKTTGALEHTHLALRNVFQLVKDAGRDCGWDIAPHDGRAASITLSLTDPNKPALDRVMTYYDHKNLSTTLRYRNPARFPAGHHKNPFGPDWRTQGF